MKTIATLVALSLAIVIGGCTIDFTQFRRTQVDGYGEIFWRKALGRPDTTTLSEGFEIKACYDKWTTVGAPGSGSGVDIALPTPYGVSWWDGPSDNEYYRIWFIIPNLHDGRANDPKWNSYTHVMPVIRREVRWTVPGGLFGSGSVGVRRLEPQATAFVFGKDPVRLSFEVVLGLYTPPHPDPCEAHVKR